MTIEISSNLHGGAVEAMVIDGARSEFPGQFDFRMRGPAPESVLLLRRRR